SAHPRAAKERENVDKNDNCAVRSNFSEHRRYSIGCDQETKSLSQRPTGSRHRPARRPTFRSLQSHQSLPSRSYKRWYPWLQSNARALLNYTDHGGGAAGNARRPLVAFFQVRTREVIADVGEKFGGNIDRTAACWFGESRTPLHKTCLPSPNCRL